MWICGYCVLCHTQTLLGLIYKVKMFELVPCLLLGIFNLCSEDVLGGGYHSEQYVHRPAGESVLVNETSTSDDASITIVQPSPEAWGTVIANTPPDKIGKCNHFKDRSSVENLITSKWMFNFFVFSLHFGVIIFFLRQCEYWYFFFILWFAFLEDT